MAFIFVSLGPALFQHSRHVGRQSKEDVYMIKIFAICLLCYYSCLPFIHLEVMILYLSFTLLSSSVLCLFVWIQFWFTFLKTCVFWMFCILFTLVCIPGSTSSVTRKQETYEWASCWRSSQIQTRKAGWLMVVNKEIGRRGDWWRIQALGCQIPLTCKRNWKCVLHKNK